MDWLFAFFKVFYDISMSLNNIVIGGVGFFYLILSGVLMNIIIRNIVN